MKAIVRKALDDIQTIPYERLISMIDQYDEISFDIFDTLIKRDVPTPKSVFEIIEFNTGEDGFAQKRIQAEKRARVKKGEVNLEDIYEEMEDIPEERKRFLLNTEIEHELNLCHVNLKLLPIYEYACQHKRVFISSDMYLSQSVIGRILSENGITGYEALIISNEVDKAKSDGSMFDYVVNHFHCKKLLHIGNGFMSDWVMAKRHHISAVKIRTCTSWLGRRYKNAPRDRRSAYLEAFLSNRHNDSNGYYYTFGFERFGPVLYGFTKWLLEEMRSKNIEQVLFMARDGYIMQEAYLALKYDKVIPNRYFEVSRRSLRVPTYCESSELKDIMENNSIISRSSIEQLLDNFGLDAEKYSDIIKKYGFGGDKRFNRDEFANDPEFVDFFNEIKQDVQENAKIEMSNLLLYLSQFDYSKKTAIVDIGWGGSMQRYLFKSLDKYKIPHDITGYYFGISKRWRSQPDDKSYQGKGYLFDCLNDDQSKDIVIPFRCFFETLFLEQKGSVKCYASQGDATVAVRYDYEYEKNGKLEPEAIAVREIHSGALDFVRAFQNSKIRDYVGYDSRTMFKYLYQTGTMPCLEDAEMFGGFRYFDNGKSNYLAPKGRVGYYLLHHKKFLRDFSDAQWKIGFFKRTLKVHFPYRKIYMVLRKVGIKKDIS